MLLVAMVMVLSGMFLALTFPSTSLRTGLEGDRDGAEAGPKTARTMAVDRCQLVDVQGGHAINWCLTTADILEKTEQVRPKIILSAHILQPQTGQLLPKAPIEPEKCVYLEDPAGHRFHAISLGGAASQGLVLRDGDAVAGWFLFPNLPQNASFALVFPGADLVIEPIVLR